MRPLYKFLLSILLINSALAMPTSAMSAVDMVLDTGSIQPPDFIETVKTKNLPGTSGRFILNASPSPDSRYIAYEVYGSSLFIYDTQTESSIDLGSVNNPVWDELGRLHFQKTIENEDHTEEILYFHYSPTTGVESPLAPGEARPNFIPTVHEQRSRAKRAIPSTASVTGMSGWSIFLDQGHSQKENEGLYRYSEAEKVLRIGLHLRQMLLEQTDIDTVYVARTTDNDFVGLTQRTTMANALGASFYYSIHSNAGAPSTNNTLMLWGANGAGVEKTPQGGKKMGDIMILDLTAAMRIPTIGSRGDSPFYGFTTRTTPYLHVNRESNMASVLSEGGFHTNPTQQQRNLNAEWKKLEAQSAFWSILRYHGLRRPQVGILTGILTDIESGRPINGATVTVGDRFYTTDTYESLFNRHSNIPDELANGFYYMENFTPGATVSVSITAPGFRPATRQITLRDTTFTFLDVGLISTVPPSVVFASVANGALNLVPGDPILIRFSRPMKRDSVIANIRITNGTLQPNHRWISNTELEIRIASEFLTDVTLTITEGAEDNFDNALIPFSISYRTRPEDMVPPQIIAISPEDGSTNVDQLTIISVTYDEPLAPDLGIEFPIRVSVAGRQDSVAMRAYQVFTLGNRSMIQFYPAAPLQDNTDYEVTVVRGISDRFGNRTTSVQFFEFSTGSRVTQRTVIDAFATVDSWWVPQQSGSTTGIQTEQTSRTARQPGFPMLSGGNAMHLNYGWLADGPNWLIREYMIPSASNNLRFNKNRVLQAYILGDGSGVRFRFMLRDGNNQLEGSPWIPITWIGWKKVEWDLRPGISTPWVNGNGVLDGTLYTDSFQLTHTLGNPLSGSIAIDDYAHVDVVAETSVETRDEERGTTDDFALAQNYPNPFNPSTQIRFQVGTQHLASLRLAVFDVLGREIAVLVNGAMPAGTHQVTFNGDGLSSGVYLVRLVAGNEVRTIRMMLLK